MFIDTHTHLYADEIMADIDTKMTDALAANVKQMFMPNIDRDSIAPMLQLADQYPDVCMPTMGLHPCYVKEDYKEALEEMYAYFDQRKFYGVGETGLDYYWDTTFVKQQKESFAIQIEWSRELELPIIIHSRDSLDDGIEMITSQQRGDLKGIFHCFNGTIDQARKALDCGFYLGLGGVITFKNAKLEPMVEYVPMDRIVLETDAPYLTPHPHRGKKNECKYLPLVAEKIATVKQMGLDEVANITTANAQRLFG